MYKIPLYKVSDISGFAHKDGFTLCTDCAEDYNRDKLNPIFLGDEFDNIPYCTDCKIEIDVICLNYCYFHRSYECNCFDRS